MGDVGSGFDDPMDQCVADSQPMDMDTQVFSPEQADSQQDPGCDFLPPDDSQVGCEPESEPVSAKPAGESNQKAPSSMPPPPKPDAAFLERKRQVQARLEEIRWGVTKYKTYRTNTSQNYC